VRDEPRGQAARGIRFPDYLYSRPGPRQTGSRGLEGGGWRGLRVGTAPTPRAARPEPECAAGPNEATPDGSRRSGSGWSR